jgi:hypothetical protein
LSQPGLVSCVGHNALEEQEEVGELDARIVG